jgi:hypothetical protein
MLFKDIDRKIALAVLLAGSLVAASAADAKDTRTEEPVFEFSSSFVSPQDSATPGFYIWKINRIDGSLYLCQTTSANVHCGQVAGPSGETGPFSLSDAVNPHAGKNLAGFYVWRLNRWTGTQELCVSSNAQHGCSK